MTEEATDSRRGLLVVTLILIAAFGPYLTGGLRTEQLMVYGVAATLTCLTFGRWRPTVHAVAVGLLWATYAGVVAIGAAWTPSASAPWPAGSTFAGMDNALLPIAVLAVMWGLLSSGAIRELLLRRAALWVVVMMLVNTAAAGLTAYRDVSWDAFWSRTDVVGTATATNAAELGRFSGLLNQPAEAGILYSVALMCALYLWSERANILLPICAVLGFGGLMTVSKVFLMVGLPIAIWQLFRIGQRRASRLIGTGIFVAGLFAAARLGWLPEWAGAKHLQAIFPDSQTSFVEAASGGRYGSGSTLGPVMASVFHGSPWFGFGAGGLQVAYDSGVTEAFVVGGAVGLACMAGVFLLLANSWWRAPRDDERRLAGCLLLVLAASNLGVPALTSNRVSTVVWVLVAISLNRPVTQQTPAPTTGMDACQKSSGTAGDAASARLSSPRGTPQAHVEGR